MTAPSTAPIDVPIPTLIAQSVLIEDDRVDILDRRVFPFERTWVTCRDVEEVATAIEDMVTQSSGPFFAAAGGMVLAARAAAPSTASDRITTLEAARKRLIATRPTNDGIQMATARLVQAGRAAADSDDFAARIETAARAEGDAYLARSWALGAVAAELIEDGDTILTHCWGESYVTETFAAAMRAGKRVSAICTETRPYLQGSRLTAESLAEMGVDTTVITDGMAAWVLAQGKVDLVITAADRITLDGHVINKVGTLGIAIAAHTYGIPYCALVQTPDAGAPTAADVPLEDRDGEEVLHVLGHRTASHKVAGYYPAFDVTPPRFVSAVATDRGRFSPHDLRSYHALSPAEPDPTGPTAPVAASDPVPPTDPGVRTDPSAHTDERITS